MTDSTLDAYLASDEDPPKCKTCRDYPKADADIREFLRRKAAGEIHLPVTSTRGRRSLFTFLKKSHGYKLSHQSLQRHIDLCLGLNHTTGEPHGE